MAGEFRRTSAKKNCRPPLEKPARNSIGPDALAVADLSVQPGAKFGRFRGNHASKVRLAACGCCTHLALLESASSDDSGVFTSLCMRERSGKAGKSEDAEESHFVCRVKKRKGN